MTSLRAYAERRDQAQAIDARPQIRALTIFAARKQSFDVRTPAETTPTEAVAALFATMPLEQHDWSPMRARILLLKETFSERLWRMERG